MMMVMMIMMMMMIVMMMLTTFARDKLAGVDPTKVREDRKHEGFPSGGHALPSLSLVPVWKDSPIKPSWRQVTRLDQQQEGN
jgi:hypothetical protein